PSIAVSKSGTLDAGTDGGVGGQVTYAFLITNTGNVTLTDVGFADAKLGVTSIPGDAVWTDGSVADGLAPNGTITFERTYTIDQVDVDAGAVINTAEVVGTPPTGDPVEGDDGDTIPTQPQAPAMTLAKTSSSARRLRA